MHILLLHSDMFDESIMGRFIRNSQDKSAYQTCNQVATNQLHEWTTPVRQFCRQLRDGKG